MHRYFAPALLGLLITAPLSEAATDHCQGVLLGAEPHCLPALSAPRLPPCSRRKPGQSADAFNTERYGRRDRENTNTARLRQLGPEFEALIEDEGLVFRLDQFEAWLQAYPAQGKSPQAARDAFAQQLGTRRVYRELALTTAELEVISS